MRRHHYYLFAIMLLALALRLFLTFQAPSLTYESYFHLRHAEHLAEHGFPLYEDPLSYGGRELRFLPFFHYFMAFFLLFLPQSIVTKVIPQLLYVSIIPLAFLLARKVQVSSREEKGPLLAAFIAAFLPILFRPYSFTPDALFIPLVFLVLYIFLNVSPARDSSSTASDAALGTVPRAPSGTRSLAWYIIAFLLLSFTTPAAALLLLGFGIYVLLSLVEGKRIPREQAELMLASLFFYLWMQFLFFKDTLLKEGLGFVWQNIPEAIISEYFPQFSLGEAIVMVSVIPFLTGIYIAYRSLFRFHNQPSFLLISLVLSTSTLAWFRLVPLRLSLSFLAVILAIFFATFYDETALFVSRTKFHTSRRWLFPAFMLLLAATMLFPAVQAAAKQHSPTAEEVQAFQWAKTYIPEGATAAASLEEGHLITYFAGRKNILDDEFNLIPDAEQRFKDINSLFSTSFQTHALGILQKYQVKYIIITPPTREKYGFDELRYYTPECFRKLEYGGAALYEVLCTLREQ